MRLKIETKNAAKIEAALAATNGRAERFTITSYSVIESVAERVEKRLSKSLLPKSERTGTKAVYRPEGPAAKAYKYASTSTLITIERGATGWFLVDVEKTEVYPAASELVRVTITQAQRDAIMARSVADYVVAKPEVETPIAA